MRIAAGRWSAPREITFNGRLLDIASLDQGSTMLGRDASWHAVAQPISGAGTRIAAPAVDSTIAGRGTRYADGRFSPPGANYLGRRFSLSPDGDRLAVQVLRDGNESDVWIKQLQRAPYANTKLTFSGDNANPVWSADGRWLWYSNGASGQRGLVLRRRADGTGAVDTVARVARGINEVLLTPDSNRLVLRATAPPSRDIVQWQRGRDTLMPLVATPTVNEIAPALSPDGKWLAYSSDESGR